MTDPTTTPEVLAAALRALADEIKAPDDVPAMCLRDAAAMVLDQAEELAALRRNRAAWEASGQDAEKRSRYAEARALLLEAEITRLGKEIERRDQSLASRRKIVREAFGRVRPLKAMVSELEAVAAAAREVLDGINQRDEDEDEWCAAGRRVSAVEMHARRLRLARALAALPAAAPQPSLPESRGTTSGQLLQMYDREENKDAYGADSEGGEA